MCYSVKAFKYDVLIDPEDLCDRVRERKSLFKAAQSGKRIILFAPRRYGKTSIVKNIVGHDFQKASPKNILLSFDLMDAGNLKVIEERLKHGLSQALSTRFSAKKILSEIVSYLKGVTIQIGPSPTTGQPSVEITAQKKESKGNINEYFRSIIDISKKYKTMIVLDEFQDISFVSGAEALFRMFLQELSDTSVFILGSKRHLLKMMFQDANAPLFHYGDEMHLDPISVDDWLPYFNERLSPVGLKIERSALEWLTESLNDVPNAICKVGEWAYKNTSRRTKITPDIIKEQL